MKKRFIVGDDWNDFVGKFYYVFDRENEEGGCPMFKTKQEAQADADEKNALGDKAPYERSEDTDYVQNYFDVPGRYGEGE